MNQRGLLADLNVALRDFPLLEGVTEEALGELASLARCHDYPKNNILLYQGDPAGSVYLVVSGLVKITGTNEEGKEVIMTRVEAGGLFGLIAALDEGAQPGNAVTVEPCRLAQFRGSEFVSWLKRQRSMQQQLLRELGGRVREAYQKIGEHALMGVKERLLYALLDIAEREGKLAPGGDVVFKRPTHQELAYRIGSSREVVSRLLKELLDSDLLQAEGRVIRVSEAALVLGEE